VAVRPDFFIVGAPKCGTTSLARYLAEHPSIFICEPKEPNYFARELIEHPGSTDRSEAPWRYDRQAYLALFAAADRRHLAVGEASTTYLYSQQALAGIRSFNPEARIVAMLRNPVDLAQSLHAQKVIEGEETVDDFAAAWRLQTERSRGSGFERPPVRPRMLLYGSVAKLGEQVERLLQVFPRQQVKLILFEDFAAAPGSTYREVLDFLGLEDDDRTDFAIENPGRRITRPWLWTLARWRPGGLLAPLRRMGRRAGLGGLAARLMVAGTSIMPRAGLDPALRSELETYFETDIRLLESLLDRDLGSWRNRAHTRDMG